MKKLLAAVAAIALMVPAVAGAQTGSEPSGQLQFEYNNYKHITSLATTTFTSPKLLVSICVNTKGATGSTATVYDNTAGSGTVIAVIDTTAGPACWTYNIALTTGLTIVTATGTAGDLTVTYR